MNFHELEQAFATTTTQAAATKPLVKILVYLAGPLESGPFTPTRNLRTACAIAEDVRRNAAQHGIYAAVLIPHASLITDMITPRSREAWLEDDMVFLSHADVVFRYGGKSDGADREVAHAKANGIDVAYGLGQFVDWCRARNDRSQSGNAR